MLFFSTKNCFSPPFFDSAESAPAFQRFSFFGKDQSSSPIITNRVTTKF
jgi:hypothetical protein